MKNNERIEDIINEFSKLDKDIQEKAMKLALYKIHIEKFRTLTAYNIGMKELDYIKTMLEFKYNKLDVNVLFDTVLISFNLGYIQGYRHCRDYGLEPVEDIEYVNPVDCNKEIRRIETLDILPALNKYIKE